MHNPGDNIDIWVVEKSLGSGGMGSVYRCHNRTATRILAAIKTLDSEFRRSNSAKERFIREAEILFQLDHPNIVKVRNIRTDAEPPYLEMEFIEGDTLDIQLEGGPLPIYMAMEVMFQLAGAVAYLHRKNIRHRDIKPANLLICPDGTLKLVDFGLAMEADRARLTQTSMTFGTVSYAPPEWINPDALDPVRWDMYSMGIVFWEILTGKVAFPVSTQGNIRQQALQVILSKQNHEPLDPGAAYHEPLRQLIRELTDPRPEKRLFNAEEVVYRLKSCERSLAGPYGFTPVPHMRHTQNTWVDRGETPAPTERILQPAHEHISPAFDRIQSPNLDSTLATENFVGKSPKVSWVPSALILGGAAFLVMGGLLGSLLIGVHLTPDGSATEHPTRTVSIDIGQHTETVALWLDETPMIKTSERTWNSTSVPAGKHTVRAVIGENCPTACNEFYIPVAVEPGSGEFSTKIELPAIFSH